MKTKAIVFPAAGAVELRELTLPDPTPKDLVVETVKSAISVGTERWLYQGKRQEIAFPTVPGYLGIGRVLEVGSEAAARGHRVGELVNFSTSRLPAGYDRTWMGTHLSHAVINACDGVDYVEGEFNATLIEKVPEGCTPEQVALTQLCAVAYRGIEMATVPAGVKVLVNGLGVLGQFAVQLCRLKGARVAAADVRESRLRLARKYGAEWLIDSRKEKVVEVAPEITGGKGFDIIIDTSSIPAVCMEIFPALRLYGKFIFQGWYPPPSTFDCNLMHGRIPTCYFPCGDTGRETRVAMEQVAAGLIDELKMITHTVRPEEAPAIYRMIDENREEFMGILFDWGTR